MHGAGDVLFDQAEACGELEQRKIADVAGQFGMRVRVAQHQILHDKLDIDDAAAVVLEVEAAAVVRVRIEHGLPHRGDFRAQRAGFALAAKNFRAQRFECGAEPAVAGDKTRARQRLVLGQVKTDEKSNEITAIPKLLDMLAIEGAIVTIDAMGCQRAIARKILDKKADYLFGLKGNQGSLREDVELLVKEQKSRNFADSTISRAETVDADNGRIETRTCTVIHDIEWLRERHGWPGLNAVAIVDSTRESDGKIERETRYYVTSLVIQAHLLAPVIRSHWAIENSLHWVMDMVFRDDECRVRTNHAPANFTTIKHMAYNMLRRPGGKDSIRVRRKTAGWDDEFLAALVTG